jgi:hypothetical protein
MVDLLRKHFVAFALDNASVPNVTPAEALWLKDRGGRACTQGMTVFTAGGQMLGSGGGYQAPGNIKMLRDALTKYKAEGKVEIGDPDAAVPADESGVRGYPRKVPRPVKDGLVLFVSWKVLSGLPDQPALPDVGGGAQYYKFWKRMVGVDRVWAGKAEAAALARDSVPDKLKQRLAVHVAYVMGSAVKSFDLSLRAQRLGGSILLANGERCGLLGFVEAEDGKLRRFELIIKGRNVGDAHKDGMAAGPLTVLSKDTKVEIGLAFMLVDPTDELARVRPLASRDLRGGEER